MVKSEFGQVKLQLAFHFRLAAIEMRDLANGCTSTWPKPKQQEIHLRMRKEIRRSAIHDPQG